MQGAAPKERRGDAVVHQECSGLWIEERNNDQEEADLRGDEGVRRSTGEKSKKVSMDVEYIKRVTGQAYRLVGGR